LEEALKGSWVVLLLVAMASAVCFAAADGAWLKKVPQGDREKVNPYAGQAAAAEAGGNLYRVNCAHCHGEKAEGKGSRPSLRSERIRKASDGEIAWLLKNGNTYHGMPSWGGLPEQERWQVVTYVRSLSDATGNGAAGGKQ
jgi:mono/diheme cytochrome c family protein